MSRHFLPWWLVLLGLVACAPTRPSIKERLDASERAFSSGQVLEAYRLLSHPELQKQTEARAVQLKKAVSEAASFIITRFIEKAENLYKQGLLLESRRYLAELSSLLPADDPLQESIGRRTRAIDEQIDNLQKEMSQLYAQAKADFEAGRVDQARYQLRSAQNLAGKYYLPPPLELELLLAECLRRSPPPVTSDEALEELLRPPAEPAGTPPRKKAVPEKTSRPVETPPAPPDQHAEEIERMLRQASEAVRSGNHLEAIEIYRQVLKLDAGCQQARRALDELEPVRQRLIKELLEKAAQYFARQELDAAAPFYEKVLRIDPGNLRAKEGLEMWRRLRELREKSHPSGN